MKESKNRTKGRSRPTKRALPSKPQTSPGHKERFNQLLDDAILGVKKK